MNTSSIPPSSLSRLELCARWLLAETLRRLPQGELL